MTETSTDSSWTQAIPWGGYQQGGPAYVAGGKVLKAAAHQMAPQPSYVGAPYVGQRPMLGVLGLTVLGLALFGGAGALAGWLLGGTQKAALVGALLGVSAPPIGSSLLHMREGGGGL